MMNSVRPMATTCWLGLASCHAPRPAHGTARQSVRGQRSPHPAWLGRRGWQELVSGPRAAQLVRRASGVVPGKETGAATHPSGRSMSRRRQRLGGGTHRL
jgi:hypothetical protein